MTNLDFNVEKKRVRLNLIITCFFTSTKAIFKDYNKPKSKSNINILANCKKALCGKKRGIFNIYISLYI